MRRWHWDGADVALVSASPRSGPIPKLSDPHWHFSAKPTPQALPAPALLIWLIGWTEHPPPRRAASCHDGWFPAHAAWSTGASETTYRIIPISSDEGSRAISHKETRALTVTADDVQQLHLVCNQFRLHFRHWSIFFGVLIFFFFLAYPENYVHCSSCCVCARLRKCSLSNPQWPAKAPKQAVRINSSPDKILLNPNR